MITSEDEKNFQNEVLNISLTQVTVWISRNLKPENVFSNADLSKWALEHGFKVRG